MTQHSSHADTNALLADPDVLATCAARILARRDGDPVLDPARNAIARRLIRRAVLSSLGLSLQTKARLQ